MNRRIRVLQTLPRFNIKIRSILPIPDESLFKEIKAKVIEKINEFS